MKPFDLEAALAGAPVCTRDGRKVTQLTKFDCECEYCLIGIADGELLSWHESGRHIKSMKSDNDLFMAPTKKTGWVARYADFVGAQAYQTEAESKYAYPSALSYHKIEWEE